MPEDIAPELAEADVALQRLLEVLSVPKALGSEVLLWSYNKKTEALAMTWPSLAAALADLMESQGYATPRSLRFARLALKEEREDASGNSTA